MNGAAQGVVTMQHVIVGAMLSQDPSGPRAPAPLA